MNPIVDPLDPRLRPKTVIAERWVVSVPCTMPDGKHIWGHRSLGRSGWDQRIRHCKACKRDRRALVTRQSVPDSAGQRGPISNIEFIALFLLRNGPSERDDVRRALCQFRLRDPDDDLRYGEDKVRPYAPNPSGVKMFQEQDSRGRFWCGDRQTARDTYWWCSPLPSKGRRRVYSPLQLTDLGREVAERANRKALEFLAEKEMGC